MKRRFWLSREMSSKLDIIKVNCASNVSRETYKNIKGIIIDTQPNYVSRETKFIKELRKCCGNQGYIMV